MKYLANDVLVDTTCSSNLGRARSDEKEMMTTLHTRNVYTSLTQPFYPRNKEENSGKLIRFLQINDLSKTGHRMWMSFGGLIMCTLLVLLHLSHFTEVEVPSENICVCFAPLRLHYILT